MQAHQASTFPISAIHIGNSATWAQEAIFKNEYDKKPFYRLFCLYQKMIDHTVRKNKGETVCTVSCC
ncbi:hypothetical protein BSU04nite_04770 [Bacillus spizizenii]|nr:hypothetical protein BSU04nite_04770 [Bacillus spizizenii]